MHLQLLPPGPSGVVFSLLTEAEPSRIQPGTFPEGWKQMFHNQKGFYALMVPDQSPNPGQASPHRASFLTQKRIGSK